MNIVFSASTRAFYDTENWPHDLPDDAVEVSAEDHTALLEAAAEGKVIIGAPDGQPVAVEPPPASAAELATAARRRRDAEIVAVRWLVDRHRDEEALSLPTTLTAAAATAVLQHVQALRDVPAQPGFPAEIQWPVLPADIINQENN